MADYLVPLDGFRAAREKQRKARRRDRGGIFQPLEKNGLLDVLMARRKSGRVPRPDKSSSPVRAEEDASDQPRKRKVSEAGVRKEKWIDLSAVGTRAKKVLKVDKPRPQRRSTIIRKVSKATTEVGTSGGDGEDRGDVEPPKLRRPSKKTLQDGPSSKLSHNRSGSASREKALPPAPMEETPYLEPDMAWEELDAEPSPPPISSTISKRRRTSRADDEAAAPSRIKSAMADPAPRVRKRKQEDVSLVPSWDAEQSPQPVLKKRRKSPEPVEDESPPKRRPKLVTRAKVTTYANVDEETPMHRQVETTKAKKSRIPKDIMDDTDGKANGVKRKLKDTVDTAPKVSKPSRNTKVHVEEDEELPPWQMIEPASPEYDISVSIKDGPSATVAAVTKRSNIQVDGSDDSPPPPKPRKKRGIEVIIIHNPPPVVRRRKRTANKSNKASSIAKENSARKKASKKMQDSSDEDDTVVQAASRGQPLDDKTNAEVTTMRRKRKLGKVPDAVWELAKYGSRRHTVFVRPPSDGEEDELDMLSS
ncbi:hypothetical protein CALVIDRAFT_597512 [Calocera viscosa TUFC12733]|uniref:Uncharacterized protein n=1 Tax=Calocera viscosa (strain TUFC12733) TaxID=1330018 RepID=A0A167NDP1_CALVF|nr:hypothetical protein CALVIDRAFT_597512 [Calocera viscosa TUFC12733]